jgi:hypothetical protein
MTSPFQSQILLLPLLSCVALHSAFGSVEKIERLGDNGGQQLEVCGGEYSGLAMISAPEKTGGVYALRVNGGIDWVYSLGSTWKATPILTEGKFTAICGRANQDGMLFGIDDQGLSWIAYDQGWKAIPLVQGQYSAIAARNGSGTNTTGVFALRKDGGIDSIDGTSGEWRASSVIDGDYVSLGTSWTNPDELFAVRKDGGLDLVTFDQSWKSRQLLEGDFIAVAGDTRQKEKLAFFAIRKDGEVIHASGMDGHLNIEKIGQTDGTVLAENFGKQSGVFVALPGGGTGRAPSAKKLPPIPEMMYGVNQYNVGPPKDAASGWPLTTGAIKYLKSELGLNTVRFPLYPAEVGIDAKQLCNWKPGETFDAKKADREWKFDWRSLDAVMDVLLDAGVTPHVSPSIEDGSPRWASKLWPRLYHPENFERCLWFTTKVVEHLQKKYGDRIAYSYFENWWWVSLDPPDKMNWRLPPLFKKELSTLYGGDLAALNKSWKTKHTSFDAIDLPQLSLDYGDESARPEWQRGLGKVNLEMINTPQGRDARKVFDQLFLRNLQAISAAVKKISPGALWCGPSGCNEMSGLYDMRSSPGLRLNASLATLAQGSDVLFIDTYGPAPVLKANYRTAAKVANVYGKKIFVSEISGRQLEAFSAVADVGGPSLGSLIWCGMDAADDSEYGVLKLSGAAIPERMLAAKRFGEAMRQYPATIETYRPGRLKVYIPLEIWNYSLIKTNHVDAYMRLFETIPAEDIEPVLTSELADLPKDAPIFVFDKVLPLNAIKELKRLGSQVVCPHGEWIDENGEKYRRTVASGNAFFEELLKLRDGRAMFDAFRCVVANENAVTYPDLGAVASSPSELAQNNVVIGGRANDWKNTIDGSVFDGVTLATKPQQEIINVKLPENKSLSSAYVDLFQGDGLKVVASRLPQSIRILLSADGKEYREVAKTGTIAGKFYYHLDFPKESAVFIRFDFGYNDGGEGLRIVNVGAY